MTSESTLRTVTPDELPELLAGLDVEETTGLALIGRHLRLASSPDYWPKGLQGHVVFQLTRNLIGLPRELLRLERLQALTLWSLGLKDADATAIAERLGQLAVLDLSMNEVSDAGAQAICKHLGRLTSLDLGNVAEVCSWREWRLTPGNRIGDTSIRMIRQYLGQITSLDLGHSEISAARVHVIGECLGQLTSLNLSGNNVGDAGARVIAERLGRLASLDLADNNVGKAGARVVAERLGQLACLNLSANRVGDAGARVIAERLGHLASLDLRHNRVGDAGARVIAEHLGQLVRLHLGSNKVGDEAVAAIGQHLGRLETLDLGSNGRIKTVAPLAHLPLSTLNLAATGVTDLSPLKALVLSGLPVKWSDEWWEGHEFPIADGRSFRLNAWDFGGQQIYHATHQFFLTRRSLYVLVDDTRSDNKSIHDEGFKFWLEVVETLSEGSPLLIFQNEKGGRSKQIDEAGIKGRFPNVQEVHGGNLEHPGAADDLRRAVEYFAQRLSHIGEDVPAKWIAIRRDLEELAQSRPYIPLEEYLSVYGRHLELNREKALLLSQYLHDLGVFLHFREPRELGRTVFLQNQWVTDAVFRILDDEQVKARRGRFTLADCDRLWSDRGYADKDLELRALMARFELCYRLPDTDPETWLAPQHLSPSKPPELSDWARTGDLMLTYRYAFLPRGLVSRLIVRMHRFVKQPDLCWSRGALFEHDGTAVLVETTARGNEIALRSRGPEHKALLSVIASDLDALNGSFPGLKDKVGKWVPCISRTCTGLTEPAMFAQKELIERKTRGKRTIECPKPPDYADVEVLGLLDGLELTRLPEWAGEPTVVDAPFAVAVSFPGEHRDFVLDVVERLAGVLGRHRVFYDAWYEARLLGSGGDLKLQASYQEAELVVPFFSEHYAKPWCALEWETIRGVLLTRREEDAVIPVHLDDTEIPGWPAVSFGIKPKGRTAQQIAELILDVYRLRHPVR